MAQFTNTHKTQVVDQVTDKWTEQNEIARVEIRDEIYCIYSIFVRFSLCFFQTDLLVGPETKMKFYI